MGSGDTGRKESWYSRNLEKGRAYANTKRRLTDWRVLMWRNAKQRARRKNLDFNIEVKDLIIPDECPVLNIPLFLGDGIPCNNSPSIDRIDNAKGYVRGNVRVISYRANSIRKNATKTEIEKVIEDLLKTVYAV
jgi:hypothetical protein